MSTQTLVNMAVAVIAVARGIIGSALRVAFAKGRGFSGRKAMTRQLHCVTYCAHP